MAAPLGVGLLLTSDSGRPRVLFSSVFIFFLLMKKSIVLILSASLLHFAAEATSRLVPGDYTSVQEALDISKSGDTVLVDDGVYLGNLIWPQVNNITLKSANGKEASFLDGNESGTVVSLSGLTNTLSATIDGFTIQNGFNQANSGNGYVAGGAGINMINASLVLKNCNITSNKLIGDISNFSYCIGSAINAESSKLLVSNCDFTGNSIESTYNIYGGVIYAASSQLSFSMVTFKENTATAFASIQGGVVSQNSGKLTMKNASFTQNQVTVTDAGSVSGGSCYLSGLGNGTFSNVLIGDNTLNSAFTVQGGGIWSTFSLSIIHCTIAGNHFVTGTGIGGNSVSLNNYINVTPKMKVINSILWNAEGSPFELAFVGTPSVTYSDVYGGFTGAGNIADDPQFVSGSDFHLLGTSPCVSASAATANPPLDLDGNQRPMPAGTMADLGAYETNQQPKLQHKGDMPFASFTVYPNPVHDASAIDIELESDNEVVIDVIDLAGRNMKHLFASSLSAGFHQIEFSAEGLAPGAYLIKTQIGGKTLSQKITID